MNIKKTLLLSLLLMFPVALGVSAQDSSLRVAERAISAGTASRDQMIQVARAYVEAGRHYEASKLAERVLETNPGDAEATAIREQTAQALRSVAQQKLEAARLAAEREGATDADRLAFADASFDAGDYRGAAEIYGRLPQSALTRDVRLRQARALSRAGDYYRAERIYKDLLREQSDPEIQLEYGRMLSWMGTSAAAVKTLTAAYEANRSDEDTVIALANARAWSGDRSGAIELLIEFNNANPGALESRRLLAEMQESAELRLERSARMIDAEPYNLALRAERARLLFDAGRYAGALREIEFIRKHSDERIEGLDELHAQATQRRKEAIAALDEQRRELDSVQSTASAGQSAEVLDLAKAYSSHAAYSQAIDLYERYLRQYPDDTNARIAYARVLSWDRRYGAAQRQYEIVLREMPERSDLRFEYAQTLSYDANFVPALHAFSDLTDLSDTESAHLYPDVPVKAYYNLGQIYRWHGWNDTAVDVQNRALALEPNFSAAREELSLARYRRPATTYGATYTYFEDSNDFRLNRIDVDGRAWISSRTAIEGSVGRHDFERGGNGTSATSLSAGVRHRFQDQLIGRVRVGSNLYDEGLGTRPFWGAGIDWFPNIYTRTAFDYNRYDLVYDVFTLASLGPESTITDVVDPLEIDDFRARFSYEPAGIVSFLADGSYGRISDDNRRQALHGLVSFRVWRSPFVALKVDGRYLSYDFRSRRYWSPDDYRALAGVIQVADDYRNRFYWNLEAKIGKSYERDRTSDSRAYQATVSVPVSDLFDIVGSYTYGKSGRFDNLFGGSGDDFTNYWQRRWYVGIRLTRLFSGDDRQPRDYYFDNRVLTDSPVISPVGETR